MSSDPSLRRGPSAGESLKIVRDEMQAFLDGVCVVHRPIIQRWSELLSQGAASPPAGDSRLITKEEDSCLPGTTGREEPQAMRLQPQPDNAGKIHTCKVCGAECSC